jgi:ABC-type Fe3+/spermidine/putrescine transport system ATPase subunit
MKGVPRPEIRQRVDEALEMVQLADLHARAPRQLSGGQQQRVALARALVNRPRVLLLDEPLGALDLKLRKEMQLELKHLQTRVGITFIYVTHDQEEALTMSDRIALMRQGRIEQVGTPREIYDRPRSRYVAGFIGETNLLKGEIAGSPGMVSLRPEAITLVEGAVPAGMVSCQGVLADTVYAGSLVKLYLELPSGERMMLYHSPGRPVPSAGSTVTVAWPRDMAVAVDEG